MRLRILSPLFALVLAVFSLVVLGVPAQAHSELVSSDPADGATVSSMPSAVTLTFNEEIDPTFVQVVVSDDSGVAHPVKAGAAGAVVTAPMPPEVTGGATRVRYRVVSADGHPVSGAISFTTPGAATATPTSGAASTGAPATAAPAPTAADSSAVSTTSAYALTGVAAVLIVAVGGLIFFLGRRARH